MTLIDVLAAAQTPASQAVLMKALDFDKTENTGDIERALTGIAFSSHPSHGVVNDLKVWSKLMNRQEDMFSNRFGFCFRKCLKERSPVQRSEKQSR